MRSWALRILLCLVISSVITAFVTWGFALWGSYKFDQDRYFSHIDGLRWVVSVDTGPGVTQVSRVPDNGSWVLLGEEIFDGSIVPNWSKARDRPSQALLDDPTMPWNIEMAYGWPLRSGYAEIQRNVRLVTGAPNPAKRFGAVSGIEVLDDGSGEPVPYRVLPVQPIVFGFALNTCINFVIVGSVVLSLTGARRAYRSRNGRCLKCGYNLRSAAVPGCPECGWRREASIAPSPDT